MGAMRCNALSRIGGIGAAAGGPFPWGAAADLFAGHPKRNVPRWAQPEAAQYDSEVLAWRRKMVCLWTLMFSLLVGGLFLLQL